MSRRKRAECYVSVDVEADGPIPGPHSMLALGAAARDAGGARLGNFSATLQTLPGAAPHPATAAWWERQPEAAHRAATDGAEPPADVMARFAEWLESLPGLAVFVGYPAAYDFTFTYWYLHRFVGHSPFSHSALDIKTVGMLLLGVGYREVDKRALRARWPVGGHHSHVAVEDADEQAELFVAMLAEARSRLAPDR